MEKCKGPENSVDKEFNQSNAAITILEGKLEELKNRQHQFENDNNITEENTDVNLSNKKNHLAVTNANLQKNLNMD